MVSVPAQATVEMRLSRQRLFKLAAMAGLQMASVSTADGAAFRLCASNVAGVSLVEESSGAVVQVQLAEGASVEFGQLTRDIEGMMLVVLAGQEIVSRAVVQVPIDSGLLRSPVLPKALAARMQQEIMVNRPLEECGRGSVE